MQVFVIGSKQIASEIDSLSIAAGHDVSGRFCDVSADFNLDNFDIDNALDFEAIIEVVIGSAFNKELLQLLSKLMSPEALIQSLALSTTPIESAALIDRPERVAGFSALPPLMNESIVVLAPALQTSKVTMDRSVDFWESISLRPIVVKNVSDLFVPVYCAA